VNYIHKINLPIHNHLVTKKQTQHSCVVHKPWHPNKNVKKFVSFNQQLFVATCYSVGFEGVFITCKRNTQLLNMNLSNVNGPLDTLQA
jgi:hypothetical protein